MATNLREFVKVISENFELGEDFDIETIPEVELPKTFNEDFHKNFLTPLSAKNNEGIRSHFKGQYLSTVDSRTKAGFLEIGGTEETFNELKEQEPDSMKLIDLVMKEVSKLKSKPNAPSDDKAFEAYKVETAKQIDELLKGKEAHDETLKQAIEATNKEWNGRLKETTITSMLNSKKFNDSMKREDAVYLTMKNVADSPYLLVLDENLNKKVYQKENPENLAVNDGKDMTWNDVLDKYSYDYTVKNAQPQDPAPTKVVNAPTETKISDEAGYYTIGHPNYGKKQ